MNKKMLKNFGIVSFLVIILFYILFLILPFILSPILNNYSQQISKIIEESSGFKLKIENLQIITTPNFEIGLKIKKAESFLPTDEKFLQADNFQVTLSLFPILLRKIELGIISADNINLDLKVQKNGKLLLENYIPQSKVDTKTKTPAKPFFKLSNHLPNIYIDKYKISFIDMQSNKKTASIEGDKTKISDFILDKKIKISGNGKMIIDGKEQFSYDIKLFNKIMPNVQLNDLVFNPQPSKTNTQLNFNIITVLNALSKTKLCANLKSDIKTYGSLDDIRVDGLIQINGLSIAVNNKKLPDSNILLNLKGNKIQMDSDLYTEKNEITHIKGNFKTGKSPNIDLSFKSDAKLKNIFDIIKSLTKTFGIDDLQSLSANGAIDADFNIKSNLKKIQSSGYFKIPYGNINYGLQNISINNIKSDISLDNNIINIKNTGFSVLGQPLKVSGQIQQDANANINIIADKLSIKSILLTLGQMSLLKENSFNSGILTLKASIIGKLINPNILVNLSVANLNLKNTPTNSSVILPNLNIKLNSDKKIFKGKASLNGLKVINPAARISMPGLTAIIEPKEITINPSNLSIDKIKLTVSGKIRNYLTDKINLDIKTTGNIKSTLSGNIHAASQKLSLNYSMPTFCTFAIPGFSNSKMQARGDVAITGAMANPKLNGTFVIPYIFLPDMAISISDMAVNLNGPIVKGNGTIKRITSGTMVAQNLSSNFALKGNLFYLNNIMGDAYSGKIKGNIVYNVVNGKTTVNFKGHGMNAKSTIAGAAGIKNALSGTLGFNTNLSFQGVEYTDMIKSLRGHLSFSVDDGAFGSVGSLEDFLNAKNILANSVMKLALNSITSLSTVKNTAIFKYIKGDITFSNGLANISSIKTSGPTMSYFVKGKYNILNSTTNVVILGRLSSDVVALLGPIGDLSIDKLTSYIPKFGTLTGIIIKSMTTNPAEENVASIPPLSSNDKYHKDFKVVFNGGIDSKSSVKSFKWLSNVDTSVFDMKFNVKDVKKQFTNAKKTAVEDVKKQYSDVKNSTINGVKNTVNETKKQVQDAAGEWKNLLKF